VRAFEVEWCRRFGVAHAISVNSATSALIAAMGAIGIGPGDEVITSPYTMTATAIAPLFYGGIPVFADIEADYFCLDVTSVERAITSRTKAILAVNIFGHPAELGKLRALADARGLTLSKTTLKPCLPKKKGVWPALSAISAFTALTSTSTSRPERAAFASPTTGRWRRGFS